MRTLIIVDVQRDFLPGGPLAVPNGDEVIPVINRISPSFDLVIATRDWHPPDHGSFAASHPNRKIGDVIELNGLEQLLWPVHCVQSTPGAEFAPGLDTACCARVFDKGTDAGVDSYSGFFDNGRRQSTGLAEYLRLHAVGEVHVLGLALDYCVRFTALDAAILGFRTNVIADGCRAVEMHPGDGQRAREALRASGVNIIDSNYL